MKEVMEYKVQYDNGEIKYLYGQDIKSIWCNAFILSNGIGISSISEENGTMHHTFNLAFITKSPN